MGKVGPLSHVITDVLISDLRVEIGPTFWTAIHRTVTPYEMLDQSAWT